MTLPTLVLLGSTLLSAGGEPARPRPTEKFRAEHVTLRQELARIDQELGALPTLARAEQRPAMQRVVRSLDEHIRKHAEWEEAKLYPVVDRAAGSGAQPFTASMRYEHRIVGRWLDELSREASKESADARAFSRRGDQLLGLITAHFEEEEEVLLPILDRTMTAEQFEREVLGTAKHQEHPH